MVAFNTTFALLVLVCCMSALTAEASTYKQYCKPENVTCWPTAQQWQELDSTLTGKLHQLVSTEYATCEQQGDDAFNISKTGNGACMQYHDCSKEFCDGNSDKWNIPSYSAEVVTVADVQNAIAFANKHNLEVTVKTSGHSYSGSSMGRNSLLIWMYNFVKYTEIKTNHTDSCGTDYPHAVKVGGGETWYDVYKKLGSDYHIIGGGGLTVSAAGGWLQGCGLSAMSRKHGIGIDNVLNFEVVLANGSHVVADACTNSRLFWALRGGGGGSWGVVTSVHYKIRPAETVTHLYMSIDNIVKTPVTVDSWLEKWVELSPDLDRGWGGYWTFNSLIMYFVGDKQKAEKTFINAIYAWRDALPEAEKSTVIVYVKESRSYFDSRGGVNSTDKTGMKEFNIASRLIPRDWVVENRAKAVALLRSMVREKFFTFNYILGGAVTDVSDNETSVHPAMRKAIWQMETFHDSMAQMLRDAVQDTGVGYNHASKKEPDWRNAFWGKNRQLLEELKVEFDPDNRFNCWHCVGYQGPEPEPEANSGNVLVGSIIKTLMMLVVAVLISYA